MSMCFSELTGACVFVEQVQIIEFKVIIESSPFH